MEKLGATTTPVRRPSSCVRSRASRSGVNPVVPTTAWMPRSMHQVRLSITASGWVKSTTTSAASTGPRSSPASTAATRVRSSACSTARHTAAPIWPAAPKTATRVVMRLNLSSGRADHARSARAGTAGPTSPSTGGWANSRAAAAWTSARVTASNWPSTSDRVRRSPSSAFTPSRDIFAPGPS